MNASNLPLFAINMLFVKTQMDRIHVSVHLDTQEMEK